MLPEWFRAAVKKAEPRRTEERLQLNNNRGNNRRRGRNNNRQQGGGQFQNRVDSRARGNAPQLLDKYKKLAEDAARNGDRVQSEYYLQFADHYFRVIADGKARQEEQRAKRDDNRGDQDDGDANAPRNARGRDNNDRDYDEENQSSRDTDTDDVGAGKPDDNAEANADTDAKPKRKPRKTRGDVDGQEDGAPAEPRKRAPRRRKAETEDAVENGGALDPQALPPAIGAVDAEEKPKRVRRPRKPKSEDGDSDEMKQAVG